MGMGPGARWGFSPMSARPANPILRLMIRAADEYWDSDRASYEDELNAWRERTAAPVAVVVARRPARRPVGVTATRDRRLPLRRTRSAKRLGARRTAIRA
jgi:hypothetical protein